jgi:hypothetical protein
MWEQIVGVMVRTSVVDVGCPATYGLVFSGDDAGGAGDDHGGGRELPNFSGQRLQLRATSS